MHARRSGSFAPGRLIRGGTGRLTAFFVLLSLCAATPAMATFHFMQIEQVIGGVNGDPSAQAVQLRMRFNSQHLVDRGRLIAWDAAGDNPVELIDFNTGVDNSAAGARVLAVTAGFVNYTTPTTAPDFVLANPIPENYLAAGSITFEADDDSLIVWRLSWGGDAYAGETDGAFTNDNDGEFGPPVPGPLPSTGIEGLLFQGDFAATSSNNLADYARTDGAAVVINNAGEMFTVRNTTCPDAPSDDPTDSDGDGVGDLCDLCPNDPAKNDPGVCGCGTSDEDADGNGTADCIDDEPDGSDAPDNGGDDEPHHDDPPDGGDDPDGDDGQDSGNGGDPDDDGGDSNGVPMPTTACGLGMVPASLAVFGVLCGLRLGRARSGR